MRVVKEAKERKNEILDRAMELFAAKGYDNTSVTDIMNAVGIAKGTLYYHFKSKEDILNGMIERIHYSAIERAKKVADNNEISIDEKILQTLLSLQVRDAGRLEILNEVHKPQNALMHQKMLQLMIKDVTPILAKVIMEGVEQEIFQTEHPYEGAELFIIYGNIIFDHGIMELTQDEMINKMVAFVDNMERVLGAKKGSMKYIFQMFENKGER